MEISLFLYSLNRYSEGVSIVARDAHVISWELHLHTPKKRTWIPILTDELVMILNKNFFFSLTRCGDKHECSMKGLLLPLFVEVNKWFFQATVKSFWKMMFCFCEIFLLFRWWYFNKFMSTDIKFLSRTDRHPYLKRIIIMWCSIHSTYCHWGRSPR